MQRCHLCHAANERTSFAITEGKTLSPRVRTLVPRNRILALLAIPFLPGSDRAMLFMLLFGGCVFGLNYGVWSYAGGSLPNSAWQGATLIASYRRPPSVVSIALLVTILIGVAVPKSITLTCVPSWAPINPTLSG